MTTIALRFALAFIAAESQPQAEPKPQAELMLPTPADWRFERIDFPLPFAPELKYEGYEELRFAPGMFKPESDTYFTYIFAMKITAASALDAAELQSLLETYFRGLCRAVAKEKKFDIDVSKISAQVRADQPNTEPFRSFLATVESFDPFVTGKPLTLNFEMTVNTKGNDHRIFAAISPKPADSPIWKLLRTLKDEFHQRTARDSP